MAVSKTLRFQVFRRDGHRCHYCGATPPDVKLTIDHVTPVALGGTDTADNLVTACEDCNSGKSAVPAGAPLVTAVKEREEQFRDAITAIAEDDRTREDFANAFLDAWDHAGGAELQPGWKKTIDAYRRGGLAPHMWPEIVSIAFDKPDIDDRFRYCCGIARNKVKEIQCEAAKLAGRTAEDSEPEHDTVRKRAAVQVAAFAAWYTAMGGDEEPPSPDVADAFRRSLDQITDMDLIEPGRIVAAAEYGGWFAVTDIRQAFRDMDRRDAWNAWISAWPTTYMPSETDEGGSHIGGPSDETRQRVGEQIDKLLDAEVHVSRVERAASYAGFHKSGRIYCGLTDHELEASGQHAGISRIIELWRVACMAGEISEPTEEEVRRFYDSVRRTTLAYDDKGHVIWLNDLYEAALWAGAYQDPDMSTCLPLHGSVFNAAAALPNPSGGA